MNEPIEVQGRMRLTFWGDDTRGFVAVTASSPRALDILLAQAPAGLVWDRNPNGVSATARLTDATLPTFSEWAEPLRVDPPCTLFDCHPDYRRPWRSAERHSIDSCAHSVDYGPRFTLALPYVDTVTPSLPFPS